MPFCQHPAKVDVVRHLGPVPSSTVNSPVS